MERGRSLWRSTSNPPAIANRYRWDGGDDSPDRVPYRAPGRSRKSGGWRYWAVALAPSVRAFELTNDPATRRQLELTVYQMGHRLGGKGASGRNPEWPTELKSTACMFCSGFMIRLSECCDAVIRSWIALARTPMQVGTRPSRLRISSSCTSEWASAWSPWPILFPREPGLPGDPRSETGLQHNVARLLQWTLRAADLARAGIGEDGTGASRLGLFARATDPSLACPAIEHRAAVLG